MVYIILAIVGHIFIPFGGIVIGILVAGAIDTANTMYHKEK